MQRMFLVRVKRHRYSRLSESGLYLMTLRRSVQVFYIRKLALRGLVSKANRLAFPLHGYFAVKLRHSHINCKRGLGLPSYFKHTWIYHNRC